MINKVHLTVEGIKIVGEIHLPTGGGPFPAVCICHGIPSGKPKDVDDGGYPELAQQMCRRGFAALIFNFRGAGESGGNFNLVGWTCDLKAAIDYLWESPEVDRSRLSLLGFSGGAAVAIYIAAQDTRVSCVTACACPAEFTFLSEVDEPEKVVDHFRSIGVIRDDVFPTSAKEWLDGFDEVRPADHVARIAPRPLLLVHGDRDETVPVEQARWLYREAGEPKKLVIINGAGHRLRQDRRAMKQVMDWLGNHFGCPDE